MLVRLILFSLIFIFVSNAQEAKEPIVQAQVSAKSFYMGQSFTYTILVDGSNKVKPPYLNKVPGFAVKKLEERALSSANKTGYVLRYDMIPLESGKLTIPSFPVEVNGKAFETEEIAINAQKPEAHPGLKLSILVSQNEVYVGEPFLMTFIWESEIPLFTLKAVDVKLPLLQESAFRSILPFNASAGGSKGTIGLPVSNIRMICSHEIFQKDQKRAEILKFQKVVIPRYSGEFELNPATLLCSFIPPENTKTKNQKNRNWRPSYPSYFNNDFFEQTGDVVYKRYVATSNKVSIKVKDLPIDGKPDDFYGVVGKCEVNTKVSSVVVEAGAPLHVDINISSFDFPATLKLPDLSKLSTFNRNFSIPKSKSSGEYEGSTKKFTQTLRALRTDVTAIPPVRVPYFDPKTGTYNVAQSKEIPITVKPAGKVTAFDAELSSETNLKNRLLNSPHGIRHNSLETQKMSQSSMSLPTKVLCALLIPLVLFIGFLVLTSNHRQKIHNYNAFKAKKAKSNFYSSSTSDISLLEKATRKYFADKLNLTADAHTTEDLYKQINLPKEAKEKIKEIYEAFNHHRFNEEKPQADIAHLKSKVEEVIQDVEGELKNV